MPFESKAQERFMFAKHPEIAKRWASLTDQSSLPAKKSVWDNVKLPGSEEDKVKIQKSFNDAFKAGS